MIIVDSNTTEKMIRHLEKVKSADAERRCLHMDLSGTPTEERIEIVTNIINRIGSSEDICFFFEDGHVYLFSNALPVRETRFALAELNTAAGTIVADILVDLVETKLALPQLSTMLRQRMQLIRQIETARIKAAQETAEAQRRNSIIHVPVDPTLVQTIDERRQRHTRPVVLLVEDEAFSCKLVEGVLSAHYDVTGVGDGQSAIMTYARIAPHILFLDIDLPDINGHDVLRRIKELDPACYVVMLSGNADRQHITQSMQEGAKGFVGKPFTRDKLRHYVENAIITKKNTMGVTS